MERKNTTETVKKKRSNNNDKNQRRFSDEQIKLLESVFETETRLEPNKKVEVARELGLQPRQVAIWFQNRRARWKSKQIEQDLRALRADYESLVSKFESLKQEKHSLTSQLQKLNDVARNGGSSSKNTEDSNGDLARPNEGLIMEERQVFEDSRTNNIVDDHDCDEKADASLDSLDNWYRHDLGGVLDQSRAQWLNFWF